MDFCHNRSAAHNEIVAKLKITKLKLSFSKIWIFVFNSSRSRATRAIELRKISKKMKLFKLDTPDWLANQLPSSLYEYFQGLGKRIKSDLLITKTWKILLMTLLFRKNTKKSDVWDPLLKKTHEVRYFSWIFHYFE